MNGPYTGCFGLGDHDDLFPPAHISLFGAGSGLLLLGIVPESRDGDDVLPLHRCHLLIGVKLLIHGLLDTDEKVPDELFAVLSFDGRLGRFAGAQFREL